VLRDWDDERAEMILRSCHRAMSPGAVLLVADAAIDPRNGRDRLNKLLDFEGGMILAGRLRTYAEMKQMLDQTGFRLLRTHRTGMADVLIFEARKHDGRAEGSDGAARSNQGSQRQVH
jgi:hypothetical protein